MREDFFKILPELSEKQFFMNKSAKKMYFCKLKTHIMFIKFHRDNPNQRYVKMIIDCLNNDGVIIFPTDTIYAMGCSISSSKALDRIAKIKGIKKEKANFSFIFHDLSMLSEFTRPINNDVFKMMKRNLPGAFTFILEANNNIPKVFQSKKKTIGIRIPDEPIITGLVQQLGKPIITTTITDKDEVSGFQTDPEEINEHYKDIVDIIIDGGYGDYEESTVVDCTDNEIVIIRQGKGILD